MTDGLKRAGVEAGLEVTGLDDEPPGWLAFAAAGVAGAGVLGVLVGNGAMALIAGLYAFVGPWVEGAAIGWGLHLVHGAVFAVLFGFGLDRMSGQATSLPPWKLATAGLVFAGALWLVGWSVVGPRLLEVVIDFGDGGPSWDGVALLGHALYGLAIGPGTVWVAKLGDDRSR